MNPPPTTAPPLSSLSAEVTPLPYYITSPPSSPLSAEMTQPPFSPLTVKVTPAHPFPHLSVPVRRRPGMSKVASFLGFLNCQVYRASLEAHTMCVLVIVRYTGSISTYLESSGVPIELHSTNTNCNEFCNLM